MQAALSSDEWLPPVMVPAAGVQQCSVVFSGVVQRCSVVLPAASWPGTTAAQRQHQPHFHHLAAHRHHPRIFPHDPASDPLSPNGTDQHWK